MTRLHLAFPLILLSALPAAGQTSWDPQFFDPAPARDAPEADLILPMPCGGAMAFQKVTIPMEASNPMNDVEVRLGQSGSSAGYLDYLRNDYLRGGFADPDGLATHYYIGRYELNSAQVKALRDPETCGFELSRRDILGQGGLSWFDGVDLSRIYTEWLHEHAADTLPQEDGQKAFVRLPTEVEWEYATRGGAAVEPGDFSASRFPMSEDVDAYARFDGERAGPVGVKEPNPLSIYDTYGNLEEIALEPFRLNAVGHLHGQVGGMVVRGGSYQSAQDQMRSANRKEWPLYNRGGRAQAQDTFGLRFVLTVHVGTSDPRVRAIRDAWTAAFVAGPDEGISAADTLARFIAGEVDPTRKSALENVLLALTAADAAAKTAADAQLQTTFRGAAIFLTGIWDDSAMISAIDEFIASDETYLETYKSELSEEERKYTQDGIDMQRNARAIRNDRRNLSLQGYRETLEFLTGAAAEDRTTALAIVRRRFEEAGNVYLLRALDAMEMDFETYVIRPDMNNADLLYLAVDR
ncbi:MAG: formylglycine-generating enzyme family protein [Marinibacterium sp.]|nr:formylglycine-generating enzyme family protein [Marinibacterium sp.]